jgi:alpha-tubulin suppressor-like RCC1 family protein
MGRSTRLGSLWVLVGLGACQPDAATQVLVLIRAQPGFDDASQVRVRVEAGDGALAYEGTRSVDPRSPEPLARVPLIPKDGDASRSFRLVAELLNADDQVLARIEANAGYQLDTLSELHLWFDRSCRGVVDCGPGRTCEGGSCVGACFRPSTLGELEASRPECGECQSCSDRVCVAVADDSPCGCPKDRCRGGACTPARPTNTIFGGHLHTCAGSGNDLYCWGSNRVGQLGTGGSSTTSPAKVMGGGWGEGTAAQEHTCVVKIGGTRACWGWNGNAQLGLGVAENQAQRTPIVPTTGDLEWTTLASGWFHTCGLTKTRGLACWGLNQGGASGQAVAVERVLTPTLVDGAEDWSAIAAGGFHSCGLKSDGTLWCWGLNESGELGLGDSADRTTPTQTGCPNGSCLGEWTAIGAGSFHTCAIRADGELWCWGGGLNGQLGVGPLSTEDSAVPLRVEFGQWRTISGGASHSCGLQSDGSLWCWGKNESGQLGLGDTEPRLEPASVLVPGKNEWIRVSAGRDHTCAIRSDRSLWCWGKNENGQLGLGRATPEGDAPITRPARICLPDP